MGYADYLVVGEQEPRQVTPGYQPELLVEAVADVRGNRRSVLALRRRLAYLAQPAERRVSVGNLVAWQLVSQVGFQVELAAFGYPKRVGYGVRRLREQRRHLLGGLQVELGVGTPLAVRGVERRVGADGDEYVLQPAPLRNVVVDGVGGDDAYSEVSRQPDEAAIAGRLSLHQVALELDEDVFDAEPVHISAQMSFGLRRPSLRRERGYGSPGASGQQYEAVGAVAQGLDGQARLTASAFPHAREREQLAQVGVTSPVLYQQRQVGAVVHRGLRSGNRADADVAGDARELHRAAQVVVVGQRQRRVAQIAGAQEQFFDPRRPLPERVCAVTVQFRVLHGYRLCLNQRPSASRNSSVTPPSARATS